MPTPTPTLRGDDEVESIPPALVNGIGVVGLLVVLFWMLAKGHIYTGTSHREILAAKQRELDSDKEHYEQRIADKDAQIVLWRAVGETSQAQMTETLEHSRLSVQLLQAIEARAKASGERDS